MSERYLLTSESVSEGHPDKVCDQISDAVLDAALTGDPLSRVGCETVCTNDLVAIFGEITSSSPIDFEDIARTVIAEIGYINPAYGFCADSVEIIQRVNSQSKDIKGGVDVALEARGETDVVAGEELGAGDQGMMFGYATDETPEFMPLPIMLAHQLTKRMASERHNGTIGYLRPDSKSQVTVEYSDNWEPVNVDTVLISTQHDPEADNATIERDIIRQIINPVLEEANYLHRAVKKIVNPSGRFVIGGPVGDAGLTGRKIIADTYGGASRHGGGAFSGKDPTKVDRSGAYAARHIAKNIVAAKLAKRAEVQLAYGIGIANPISIMVETFGTGTIPNANIMKLIRQNFDLRPSAIISNLSLRQPIYRPVSVYGHFGRNDLQLPWEALDKSSALARF